jgi:hypothetical protein
MVTLQRYKRPSRKYAVRENKAKKKKIRMISFVHISNVISSTVKLDLNDFGYSEFINITNKLCRILWSQIVTSLHKSSLL